MKNVTLLGGDGGTGKSLLALQLALACCTAIPHWIGMEVSTGPVLYLSAEDDENEIHRRVVEICQAEPSSDVEAIRGMLYLLDMVGEDATLAFEKGRTGVIEPTELYRQLDGILSDIAPMVLILDNLADVYAGNENNRSAAKHFIGLLRGLGLRHDCAVLLLGHPSLTGISSGSGASGSTAWSNSVRSRLYLKRTDDEDEDARVLETKKANYGRSGNVIGLNWFANRFVRKDMPTAGERLMPDTKDSVAAEAAKGCWRSSPTSEQWLGFWLADHLDMDVGQGVAANERKPGQKLARNEIVNLLKQFEKAGVIHKVMKADGRYEKRPFYDAGPSAG
jgi:RecA-family ATPase